MISLRLCTKSVWNNKLNSDPLGPMFHLYPFHPKFLSFFFEGGSLKQVSLELLKLQEMILAIPQHSPAKNWSWVHLILSVYFFICCVCKVY